MKRFNKLLKWCLEPKHLFFYFVVALIVPNLALAYTEQISIGARLTNIILPLGVYAYLFTLKRRPGMMIWVIFPFVFLAAFQLVLLYLFGNSIIAVDMFLNLVTTNPTEAMELLNDLVPAVLGVFILYLPALILGGISDYRKYRLPENFIHKFRKISYGVMGTGLVAMGITSVVDEEYDWKLHLYPTNVCYNCYIAIERTGIVADYYELSKDFQFHSVSSHESDQREIYIMVVGETGRACNWGLYGYERDTNPLLSKTPGIAVFKDVLTESNTTHKSVPMLLSPAQADNYECLYSQKGIIAAFKEAGFYTAFYSSQARNHSYIDFLGMEADTYKFLRDDLSYGETVKDETLLTCVDELLQQSHKKLFIVLHTYGSHFNYRERYPKEVAKFLPDTYSDVNHKNRPYLVNAYDNSIVNTDLFLSTIINKVQALDVVSSLLYVSDHGEDIIDDERGRFLHASPIPTYYQLHVPFVVWMSEAYRSQYKENAAAVFANVEQPIASSVSAFHTLVDLAGLQTAYKKDSLSVANPSFAPYRRFYLNDHNLPKPYDKIGLKKLDVEQLKKHRIQYP